MRKLLLALALLGFASPALAQNTQCSTRPTADSSNACASTAFVKNVAAAGTGAMVVGTTPITGGVSGRVLFDNAGILGEYLISGTGAVAMTASPGFTGSPTVTSASANAFDVGPAGATNPAFQVDASTASQVAGLKVTGAATAGTVAIAAIDSGANTNLQIKSKGSGAITLQADVGNATLLNFGVAGSSSASFTIAGATSGSTTVQPSNIASGTLTLPALTATLTATIASGAKALATGAIGSAACTAAQTDTATGAATTDVLSASFSADPTATTGYIPLTSGMLTIIPYLTANTANFKVCNNTTASITPGAVTINWRVTR